MKKISYYHVMLKFSIFMTLSICCEKTVEDREQNVNVRNGRALSSLSNIQIYVFCRKVDIFRKHFYWKKNKKKCLHTVPHSKGTIPFWDAVLNGRAHAASSWWRYAVNLQCIPELFTDFEREWSGLKQMI